jgi:glutaminyl-peptide cyclotransferase
LQRYITTAFFGVVQFPLCRFYSSRIFSWIGCFSLSIIGASLAYASEFRGPVAFAQTKQAVSFGQRPSGSVSLDKLRAWIISQLRGSGGQLSTDAFQGQTPSGPIPMTNLILKFSGTSGKAIVVSGHYDTKNIPMVNFVGANDGGSSTGFLLEFAHAVAKAKHRDDIYVVFFDGEEALGNWTETDSRYGSRHLSAKWLADGTLSHIRALINIDMIGDKELDLSNDENSSQPLRTKLRSIADRLGYTKYLRTDPAAIDDDHKPFAELGVNVLDIIDLNYGPNGGYWHTAQDTVDKLGVRSFQIVGDLTMALVQDLDSGN